MSLHSQHYPRPLVLMTKVDKAMVCVCTQAKWTGIGRGGLVRL